MRPVRATVFQVQQSVDSFGLRWCACFQALDMSADPVPESRPSEHRWRLIRHFFAGHDPLNHFLADRPLPATQFVKVPSMLFSRVVDTKLICDHTNSKLAYEWQFLGRSSSIAWAAGQEFFRFHNCAVPFLQHARQRNLRRNLLRAVSVGANLGGLHASTDRRWL